MPKPAAKSKKSENHKKILKGLAKEYTDVECALAHNDPWQLLVATILSAQCTDERVNKVTPELFRRLRTPKDFVSVPQEEIEKLIHSTGFYRNKSKSIQGAAQKVLSDHGGKVPQEMENLVKLPGVGRKTANVILGTAFGKNEGVVVDTHVGRLSRRMGFTKQKDPVKVEKDLMELIPKKDWTIISHRMIWHGRKVCKSIKPRCGECSLESLCPSSEI